ncbi:hypothetical protein ZWY2020_057857 [Hordeum vulgare]|nr:hypothetical protein ZWY2020_057857 [Hordeum vulgare]
MICVRLQYQQYIWTFIVVLSGVSPSDTEEGSLVKDKTNTPTHIHGNENPTCVIMGNQNSKGAQSSYARHTDEKRAEYNQKQHAIYREKKAATINRVNHEQMSQADASCLLGVQRTPFSNIINTLENASGSTGYQTRDVNVGWKK